VFIITRNSIFSLNFIENMVLTITTATLIDIRCRHGQNELNYNGRCIDICNFILGQSKQCLDSQLK
jgi:hypothetical protein